MSELPFNLHGACVLYDTPGARALEKEAAVALGDDPRLLMERAGRAGWQRLRELYPEAERITVISGPGNNGGDGYVLARHALEAGRRLRVIHLPYHAPRTELAKQACDAYLTAGGRIEWFPTSLDDDDVVVDALFGIGLDRAPDEITTDLITAINVCKARILSLDIPSGVDADRGCVPGAAVRADFTLQFLARHQGLYTGDALEYSCGRGFDPLGVPDRVFARVPPAAVSLEPGAMISRLPPRRFNCHKGESGRVICLGGDHGHGGAITLCAEAALRVGAGLVHVLTRAAHVPAILTRCPEIMAISDEQAEKHGEKWLSTAQVLAVGPGLGQDAWGQHWLRQALLSQCPLVLDADGLNLLAAHPCPVQDAVLTPHPGEAARLLGLDDATKIQGDRFSAAQKLVERFQTVVVLKGAGTIVAAPGQLPYVISAGNPGMATGGMGDMLTGVIASLRAQGLSAWGAAYTGALIHAAAADKAVRQGGERGLLPTDLLPWLRYWVNAGNIQRCS